VDQARSEHVERRRTRDEKARRDAVVELTAEQLDRIVEFVGGLRKPLGKGLVAKGLRGSSAKPVRRKGLSSNPAFGALRGIPEQAVFDGVVALLQAGRLVPKGRKYPTLWLPDRPVRKKRDPASSVPRTAPSGLRAALRSFRRSEASRRRWKPYQVFDNKTLGRIVAARPTSAEELLAIRGLGPKRVAKFGVQVLELVRENPAASRGEPT
jgi:ATP-dependent DNA helicase RecQ